MKLQSEIPIICDTLMLTEADLAKKLGVSLETINTWKEVKEEIEPANLEKLYSFAYENGIDLNNIYEQLFKEEYEKNQEIVLFHGAKRPFSMPIDFAGNSKKTNDFGIGFYLGQTFEQAANYIAVQKQHFVYCFVLNLDGLKTCKFNVDTDWMMTIAYFRGWLQDYQSHPLILEIAKRISAYDIIIAPIADNRMFDLIAEFVGNEITDEQCRHALAATNLGFQYVLKTDKCLKNVKLVQEMFVSEKERAKCVASRAELTMNGSQKVKAARIEYKGKGRYIQEILK